MGLIIKLNPKNFKKQQQTCQNIDVLKYINRWNGVQTWQGKSLKRRYGKKPFRYKTKSRYGTGISKDAKDVTVYVITVPVQ